MTLRIFLIYTMLAGALAKGLEKGCAKGCARGGARIGARVGDDIAGVNIGNISGPVARGFSRLIINEQGKLEKVDYGVNNDRILSLNQMDSIFSENMDSLEMITGYTTKDSVLIDELCYSSEILINALYDQDTSYLEKWSTKEPKHEGFSKFTNCLLVNSNNRYSEVLNSTLQFKLQLEEKLGKEKLHPEVIESRFRSVIKSIYFPYHEKLFKDIYNE